MLAESRRLEKAAETKRAANNVAMVADFVDAEDAAAAADPKNLCLICFDAEKTCVMVYDHAKLCKHGYCEPCISQFITICEQVANHPITGEHYTPKGPARCPLGCGPTAAPHFHNFGGFIGGLMAAYD